VLPTFFKSLILPINPILNRIRTKLYMLLLGQVIEIIQASQLPNFFKKYIPNYVYTDGRISIKVSIWLPGQVMEILRAPQLSQSMLPILKKKNII